MSKNFEELTSELANCACRNRLVLFLGAGFSRAVIGYDPTNLADHYSQAKAKGVLSWLELLDKCRAELDLPPQNYAAKKNVDIDCPLAASSIVFELLAKDPGLNYEKALFKLKDVVSQLVDWYPEQEQASAYQALLLKIKPAAIVTTNYDEVVETILGSGYFSYGPNNTFGGLPNDFTPIYHIHGIRGRIDSILITREDYVQALRFSSYRQTRLACLLRENAVLYVGYGKNDINILSALDVARNSFSDLTEGKNNIHVQLLYASMDDYKIVETDKGQYTVELKDIYEFFRQIAEKSAAIKEDINDSLDKYEKQSKLILGLSSDESNNVVKKKRPKLSKLIKLLADQIAKDNITSVHAKSLLMTVVQKFFNVVYGETHTNGNFSAYDDSLFVLLELLANMATLGTRSVFFNFVTKHLEKIAPYIGGEKGQSWDANNTLKKNWSRIPEKIVQELEESARSHNRSGTLLLLKRIKKEFTD